MRFILLCLLTTLLLFLGCATVPYYIRDYQIGKLDTVTVGSVMMGWEYGRATKSSKTPLEGYRMELSYTGIAQHAIQVLYREFLIEPEGSYARPAFSQEMRYDMTGSKIITFQDSRIRVLSADQERIIFSVEQGHADVEKADPKYVIPRYKKTILSTQLNSESTLYDNPFNVTLFLTTGDSLRGYLIGEDNTAYQMKDNPESNQVRRVRKSVIKYFRRD